MATEDLSRQLPTEAEDAGFILIYSSFTKECVLILRTGYRGYKQAIVLHCWHYIPSLTEVREKYEEIIQEGVL